ncbi:nitrate- and nitrite sensing domain-containing protein [Streptomyces sp. NPDC051287]|uniref:sensor histidine kinase n=1 Tax=Streptomyces sp. NPDC051287 TaxID=3365648 RepID=UPI0037B717C2
MRWTVGRPATVRARIVALALAPAVALTALWSFAMVSVTADLRALIRVQGVYDDFGTPVDTAVGQIQIERRLSAAYLGARPGTVSAAALSAQRRRTDRAVAALRDAVRDGDRGRLSGPQRTALDAMVTATGGLGALRERVLSRTVSWDAAVTGYNALVEPGFDVQSALTALQAGRLAREAQIVVELVRVREFVSREDALVAGARAAGRLTAAQYGGLTAAVEDRRVFERTYVADLPADSRALFERFQRGELYRSLVRGEDTLLRAGAGRAGAAVAADTWRSTTDRAVRQYMLLCSDAARNAASRGRAFAYRELTRAAVVGVVGLAVVGLSLWYSVRGARRVSRRLENLRDAADLLTAHQLPALMDRLSAGEDVDAAAEAPPLAAGEAGRDEIGDVGRSFNRARLAAVEAAVKQATLRRGLFAVLLNIARRNQALVHRQLKLVDTLERRTDDPAVLAELFRIDHLTTRMRRHAESLIILSGATPGRRWRRPVPVADVVSSAVGEIEEYPRVVVPPMPEVGVAADAVADVVHLVAELLENATVFSPPHTRVTLRTGRTGRGFTLEIDDRGLGLDAGRLAEAHRTLTDPEAFDPTRHDRLGLYVVGRLAARHGIAVTLRESPYGGTTAAVLLPPTMLAETDSGPGATKTDSGPGAAEARALASAPAVAAETDVRPGAPEAAMDGRPAVSEAAMGAGPAQPVAVMDARPAVPEAVAGAGPGAPEAVVDAGPHHDGTADAGVPPRGTADVGVRPDGTVDADVPPRGTAGPGTPPRGPADAGVLPDGPADAGVRPGGTADAGVLPDGTADAGVRPDGTVDADVPPRGTAGPGTPLRGPADAGLRPGGTADAGVPPGGAAGSGPGVARAAAGPALPTRRRQASLAPELRTEPEPEPGPVRELDADEMRAVFGALQRGLDRGRRGLPLDANEPPATDERTPRADDQ